MTGSQSVLAHQNPTVLLPGKSFQVLSFPCSYALPERAAKFCGPVIILFKTVQY
jgi:hypothetical protein